MLDLRGLQMTIKEQLLKEIQSSEDNLLEQTLNFLRYLKTKETVKASEGGGEKSTGKSLLEHLNKMDEWLGNDFEECFEAVKEAKLPAKFDTFNPFDEE